MEFTTPREKDRFPLSPAQKRFEKERGIIGFYKIKPSKESGISIHTDRLSVKCRFWQEWTTRKSGPVSPFITVVASNIETCRNRQVWTRRNGEEIDQFVQWGIWGKRGCWPLDTEKVRIEGATVAYSILYFFCDERKQKSLFIILKNDLPWHGRQLGCNHQIKERRVRFEGFFSKPSGKISILGLRQWITISIRPPFPGPFVAQMGTLCLAYCRGWSGSTPSLTPSVAVGYAAFFKYA